MEASALSRILSFFWNPRFGERRYRGGRRATESEKRKAVQFFSGGGAESTRLKMPMDMANKSCMPMVKAMILLDSEGKRITVKYYSKEWALSVKEQSNFERSLFVKTCRTNARGEPEIIMFDNHVIVYKFVADVFFYVVAGTEENEIALAQVLQALTESTSTLLRNSVEKKSILENLDLVLIAMDEIVDNGIIFETDSAQVASRVTMRGKDEGFGNISDQTLSQAFASAKEQFSKHMLR